MLSRYVRLLPFYALLLLLSVRAEEAAKPVVEKGAEFPSLTTKKGEVYHEVTVMKVEADALLVRHESGMARISLFELDSELQARYQFDPVVALKRYQEDLAIQREQRKTALLETEKRRAVAIRAEAERERLAIAKKEWFPVETTVIKMHEEGAILRASRIQMIPTQVRSTLGFLNEGPPKRVLVPFASQPVLLLDPPSHLRPGQEWKGYLNPVSERFVIDPASGLPTVPAHRGVSVSP